MNAIAKIRKQYKEIWITKSYNHLYEKFISDENYELAIHNATLNKGGKKKKRKACQYYREHKDELKPQIMAYIENFHPDPHVP